MNTTQELQNLRTELIQEIIQEINEKFDALIYNLQMEHHETENNVSGQVAEVILLKCNSDTKYHIRLMNLRDKVKGRDRVLLGSKVGNMRSPMKIDNNLYMETHYDAESLIRILTTRILESVNYNYSDIRITIRN